MKRVLFAVVSFFLGNACAMQTNYIEPSNFRELQMAVDHIRNDISEELDKVQELVGYYDYASSHTSEIKNCTGQMCIFFLRVGRLMRTFNFYLDILKVRNGGKNDGNAYSDQFAQYNDNADRKSGGDEYRKANFNIYESSLIAADISTLSLHALYIDFCDNFTMSEEWTSKLKEKLFQVSMNLYSYTSIRNEDWVQEERKKLADLNLNNCQSIRKESVIQKEESCCCRIF